MSWNLKHLFTNVKYWIIYLRLWNLFFWKFRQSFLYFCWYQIINNTYIICHYSFHLDPIILDHISFMVFLKIVPWKHVIQFRMKDKLAPRYIVAYKIIERIGTVAYQILLPPHLDRIHNVFHVSMLRKANLDPARILP